MFYTSSICSELPKRETVSRDPTGSLPALLFMQTYEEGVNLGCEVLINPSDVCICIYRY